MLSLKTWSVEILQQADIWRWNKHVFQCTNYDNIDLRILFTLESHRSTRFGVFSAHHLQEHLIVFTSVVFPVHFQHYVCLCSSEWFKRCKTCTSLSQFCTKHFYTSILCQNTYKTLIKSGWCTEKTPKRVERCDSKVNKIRKSVLP